MVNASGSSKMGSMARNINDLRGVDDLVYVALAALQGSDLVKDAIVARYPML